MYFKRHFKQLPEFSESTCANVRVNRLRKRGQAGCCPSLPYSKQRVGNARLKFTIHQEGIRLELLRLICVSNHRIVNAHYICKKSPETNSSSNGLPFCLLAFGHWHQCFLVHVFRRFFDFVSRSFSSCSAKHRVKHTTISKTHENSEKNTDGM